MTDSKRAEAFRRLHQDGLLILANVWDGGSARLIESLGAKALATTSAGVAWSHGHADGHHVPVPLLLTTVNDIARSTRLPLSVDVEGGYSDDPGTVAATVAGVIRAGAVGINIEDGSRPPELLCAKIEAIKRGAAGLGVDLFVNARTDVYLASLAPKERRVEETLVRAALYRDAGADGIFVPGLADKDEIRAVVAGAGLPLNLLVRPALPGAVELRALGVRRLSAGSDLAEAALGRIAALAVRFLKDGESGPLSEGALPYAEVQALMM